MPVGIFKNFGRDLIAAFRNRPVEHRAITSVPWGHGGPSGRSADMDNPLSLIPYFACVRTLAEQISALPMQTFRQEGELLRRATDGQLVKEPSSIHDNVTWIRQAVISLATRGNAYGIITGFDGLGFATGIEWIHPDEIYVDETNPTLPRYWWASTLGGYGEIPRERMVHIAWFVLPGKVEGLSPISAFARSIGVGLNVTNYGSEWFRNGGVPPATFKNTAKTVSTEQAEEITDRLVSSLRSGRPLTFGNDWEFNAIEIAPEEAQFIETMKINATQIAAIFGVPPEWVGGETGGSLTYNNPEQNGLHVHKIVLHPWISLLEAKFSKLLPLKQVVMFNPDGILRADTRSRYEAHEIGLRAGFLTIDEVRALENLPPLPKPKPVQQIQVPKEPGEPPADPNDDTVKINGSRFKPIRV